MNDIQKSENVKTKPKDNRLKSFVGRIERLEQEDLVYTYRNALGIF